MKNKVIALIIIILSNYPPLFSQINESFSNGNFTENPTWIGDTDKFAVQSPITSGAGSITPKWNTDEYVLQSIPEMDDAVLITESTRAYGEWLFSIADGKDWSISGTNDFAVIFISDTNAPELLKDGARNFNGYFLQFDGGSNDNFILYKQIGTTTIPIIDTGFPGGADGTSSIPYSIKIIRQTNGEWEIYIDEGLYNTPKTIRGTGNDNEIITSNYFAFATNIANPSAARVAYIDNIITRDFYVDTKPPIVNEITFINSCSIKLSLNENTEKNTTEDITNYSIQTIGNPQEANHTENSQSEIILKYNNPFPANQSLLLSLDGIEDMSGNTIDTTIQFSPPISLNSNIRESFTDGNLTQSPTWEGETENFEIISPETSNDEAFPANAQHDGAILRSKPNTASSAMIFETYRAYGQWSFSTADCKGWSISSNNDFQIILTSDNKNPTNLKTGSMNFNGYFLRFDGSYGDAFVLYKQKGTISTPIITTTTPEGDDGTLPTAFSVKITRTQSDGWKLYINQSWDTEAYSLKGTSTDNEIKTGIYFGISTNIKTPSESRIAYFDNIYVGKVIYDTIPPRLTQLQIKSKNTLKLSFSESLDTLSIGTSNFSILGNTIKQIDHKKFGMEILLQFNDDFLQREEKILKINGLKDIAGNTIKDTSATFTYITTKQGDVVINEVFFDTNPTFGLPEYDFLELYNNSEYDINLYNWILTIKDKDFTFPNIILPANKFLVITSNAAVADYEKYGTTIDLISTSTLTNTGVPITLKDTANKIIHNIEYSTDWYHDSEKTDGGWSIEQIDPNAICSMENNWRASISEIGGTPGTLNSVDANNIDNTAPFITSVDITTSNTIAILFSENIQPIHINSQHISISTIATPVVYEQDAENKKRWTITTTTEIPERIELIISFSNISDLCDNTLTDTSIAISRITPYFQQIIFNEIMPKPAPEEGLRYEYVELFNRDTLPVNLHNWQFWIGSHKWTIKNTRIKPNEYLLILPKYMASHPNTPPNAIYFFDEADLTDGGTMLKLTAPDENIITWVEYKNSWHTNELYPLGGYALERIDTDYLCGDSENWATSNAKNHGTPGEPNSIANKTTNERQPEALFYIVPKDTTLQVEFNCPMWPDTTLSNIEINGLNITKSWIEHPMGNILSMKLSEPLQESTTYQLTVSGYRDCNNNTIKNTQFTFEKPQSPEKNDLVINEILFNAPTKCNDFVELLNISNKYLAINELHTANANDLNLPEKVIPVSKKEYVLPPNSYYILTTDYQCLEDKYSPVLRNQTIITTLPTLSDAQGSIMILDKQGNTIDMMRYTDKMHNSLITNKDGVSLERISPLATSENPSNWYSAAADASFATPTRKNSNFNNTKITENNISLRSKTFSPDGDGFEDFLQINYKFSKGGYIINIRILDHTGRVVRHLVNNESVSVEGFVTWDGTDEDEHKQAIGPYIIHCEWYDENGKLKNNIINCVLAGELR